MQCLAVVSDSHIPDRFRERIRSADRTIHADDFTTEGVLERFESLAGGDEDVDVSVHGAAP